MLTGISSAALFSTAPSAQPATAEASSAFAPPPPVARQPRLERGRPGSSTRVSLGGFAAQDFRRSVAGGASSVAENEEGSMAGMVSQLMRQLHTSPAGTALLSMMAPLPDHDSEF